MKNDKPKWKIQKKTKTEPNSKKITKIMEKFTHNSSNTFCRGIFDRQDSLRSDYLSDRETRYGIVQQASIDSTDSRLCYLTSSEVSLSHFHSFILHIFSLSLRFCSVPEANPNKVRKDISLKWQKRKCERKSQVKLKNSEMSNFVFILMLS